MASTTGATTASRWDRIERPLVDPRLRFGRRRGIAGAVPGARTVAGGRRGADPRSGAAEAARPAGRAARGRRQGRVPRPPHRPPLGRGAPGPLDRLAAGLRVEPAADPGARAPPAGPRPRCCSPTRPATCSGSGPTTWTPPGSRRWPPRAGGSWPRAATAPPARRSRTPSPSGAATHWRTSPTRTSPSPRSSAGSSSARSPRRTASRPISRWEPTTRCVAELEGLVARFPHRERLWALLMVALYRGGRQGDALRAGARARAALIEDLGLDASPDLARLEADILAHAPTLMWHRDAGSEGPRRRVSRRSPCEPAGTPAAGTRGASLVGRTGELAALEQALDDAAAGRGRMVLVSGEAGIGKTRLAEELATRASAAGAIVAWGGAPEGESAPAFWPWVQVLRTILTRGGSHGSRAGHRRRRACRGTVAGAARARRRRPARVSAARPRRSRTPSRPASSCTRLSSRTLASAAADRPLVVVLDDLHWADVASLALCGFVAARLKGTRLLVVGTYRPAELSRDHPLVPTLADLARQPLLGRIELRGLDREEVGDFLAEGWGIAPSGELAAAVHARTDGNPFFVTELVKLLASEGRLGWADAVAVAHVPAGVRDVLRRRLGRLPEATNALLRVAAVIGREFDLEVLSGASDHDEERTLEAVEAALVTGIVADDPVIARALPLLPRPRPGDAVRRAQRPAQGAAARPGRGDPREPPPDPGPRGRAGPALLPGRRGRRPREGRRLRPRGRGRGAGRPGLRDGGGTPAAGPRTDPDDAGRGRPGQAGAPGPEPPGAVADDERRHGLARRRRRPTTEPPSSASPSATPASCSRRCPA